VDDSCAGVDKAYLAESGEGVRIHLLASPGAKRSRVKGSYGEHAIQFKLSVTSPPEKARANAGAEGLLAEVFGVGRPW
jgi:uncharacterized protein YggU (UPF0235/DUF167 family)